MPAVVMLFGNSETSTNENRELAATPVLVNEDGINYDFFNECDSYVSDHIGFRSQLVEANTAIFTRVFNLSPEEDVILGNNGWLYYGKDMDDYLNIPTVSDRGINSIAYTLKLLEENIESRESDFVMCFAPNKSTLYSENMPNNYIPSDNEGNLERLENALSAYDVNYVSLKSVFDADSNIYYRRQDSHWNYQGALLAYNSIMAKTSIAYDSYEKLKFADSYEWTGDLSNMLYTKDVPLDSQLVPMRTFGYTYTSKQKKVEANRLDTYNHDGVGEALIYRDSFGNTMIPFFADNFEKCHFSKITPYNMADVEECNPDVTIIELVERNIPNLAKAAPVMMAPEVTIEEDGYIVTSSRPLFTTEYEKTSDGNHIYGTIEEKILGDSYKVYAFVENESGETKCFEAFPIYEQYLIDGNDEGYPKDNGYSFYISDENSKLVKLIVESEGKYYIL